MTAKRLLEIIEAEDEVPQASWLNFRPLENIEAPHEPRFPYPKKPKKGRSLRKKGRSLRRETEIVANMSEQLEFDFGSIIFWWEDVFFQIHGYKPNEYDYLLGREVTQWGKKKGLKYFAIRYKDGLSIRKEKDGEYKRTFKFL